MFIIRRPKSDDAGTLLKLAKMVHFINLPPDRDIINAKISHCRNCFLKAGGGRVDLEQMAEHAPAFPPAFADPKGRRNGRPHTAPPPGMPGKLKARGLAESKSDVFMFVLEDTQSRGVLGTSQIIAHMGGPGNPNVSFKLEPREFFSESLQFGAKHMTAKLHMDETGPTELGGLILQPSYRSHPQKLGRTLSLVRFHFIGLHRKLFADRLIAELMAPISADGQNLLWEYLGRRFINLTYSEADRFCQYSREFMTSLLPKEEIYLTLLPPEARAVVGQVGPETVPARKMLERLGFEYRDFVDPFDGGPHLEARTDEIGITRSTYRAILAGEVDTAECNARGIVSRLDGDGDFRAGLADFRVDQQGKIRLTDDWVLALSLKPGIEVGVTVLERTAPAAPPSTPNRKSRGKSARKARRA